MAEGADAISGFVWIALSTSPKTRNRETISLSVEPGIRTCRGEDGACDVRGRRRIGTRFGDGGVVPGNAVCGGSREAGERRATRQQAAMIRLSGHNSATRQRSSVDEHEGLLHWARYPSLAGPA